MTPPTVLYEFQKSTIHATTPVAKAIRYLAYTPVIFRLSQEIVLLGITDASFHSGLSVCQAIQLMYSHAPVDPLNDHTLISTLYVSRVLAELVDSMLKDLKLLFNAYLPEGYALLTDKFYPSVVDVGANEPLLRHAGKSDLGDIIGLSHKNKEWPPTLFVVGDHEDRMSIDISMTPKTGIYPVNGIKYETEHGVYTEKDGIILLQRVPFA